MKTSNIIFYIVIAAMLVAAVLIGKPVVDRYLANQDCIDRGGAYDAANDVCLRANQDTFTITVEDIDPDTFVGDEYEGDQSEIIVTLDESIAAQRLTKDTIVAPFTIQYGGSGTFYAVGLFHQQDNGRITHQDSHVIGDRVIVENVVVPRAATVYVRYLSRYSDEPLAAVPTVTSSFLFEMDDYRLVPKIDYFNANDNDIFITEVDRISGVLEMRGEVRGTWFSEALMPVTVYGDDMEVLATTYAQPQAGSEWMTEEFVPFVVAINNSFSEVRNIRFSKTNASGLSENQAYVDIYVNE